MIFRRKKIHKIITFAKVMHYFFSTNQNIKFQLFFGWKTNFGAIYSRFNKKIYVNAQCDLSQKIF
jgi:hypothetical protein